MDWLAESARTVPGGISVRCEGAVITFAALDDAVERMAQHVRDLGVAKGQSVGVLGATSIDLVLLLLALSRLEAVVVMANTRWTWGEVARAFVVCGVDGVFTSAEMVAVGDTYVVYDYTKFMLSDQALSRVQVSGKNYDRVAYAIFTSGTSGTPKAVEITVSNLLHNAALTALRLGVRPDDHWLCCLPLFHIGGLAMLQRAMLFGLPLTLHRHFDVEAVNHAIEFEQITHISLVPTMLNRLVDARNTPLPRPVTVLLGGAAAPKDLIERARRLGFDVLSTYGLTEATSQVATQPPHALRQKIGSAGRPVPFVTVSIRGDDGAKLPAGDIGDVYVDGPTVMRGYMNDAVATAEALTPQGLRTGDLGYLDTDGDLWLVNRRTDLIISGGENIYPAEVEAALLTIPGISAACVVAVADDDWGQSPAAALVSDQRYDIESLRTNLNAVLARYKHPKQLIYLDTMPLLANGKVDRRSVAALFKSGPD